MDHCCICQKKLKPEPLVCGVCNSGICKNCTEFLPEDTFYYAGKKPQLVKSSAFCQTCYVTDINVLVSKDLELLNRAREIRVFSKSQTKETRLIKRPEFGMTINNALDEPELILKMAYQAVLLECNSIIEVETKQTKVRNGSYQTSTWSGFCYPTNVDDSKLVKDKSIRDNPN